MKISQADRQKQLEVMDEAQQIYIERSETRGQMWKDMGADDAAHHIKSKAERVFVLHHHEDGMPTEDDCLDLINYACFLIRHNRAKAAGITNKEEI